MEQDDVNTYFQELEQTFGGPLHYRTFTSFFFVSEGAVVKTSGILCIINRVLYFEDFEKTRNGLMQLFGGKSESYTKFQTKQDIDSFESHMMVPASMAAAYLEGKIHPSQLHPSAGMQKLLSKNRLILRFSSGRDWVLEPLDPKQFIKTLEELR